MLYLSFANHIVNKVPFFSIRHFIYRYLYAMKIGRGTAIHMGCRFFRPDLVVLGRNVRIQFGCLLDGRRGLVIGDNVDISFDVKIFSLQHDIDDPEYRDFEGPVNIGPRACVYANAIILPGVSIGEGAVVASGAVVTKNVAEYSVVGGVPARVIRQRNRNLTYELKEVRYFH
jgi:putative colanic acid biosynthesis acetyltransferase WcaF